MKSHIKVIGAEPERAKSVPCLQKTRSFSGNQPCCAFQLCFLNQQWHLTSHASLGGIHVKESWEVRILASLDCCASFAAGDITDNIFNLIIQHYSYRI